MADDINYRVKQWRPPARPEWVRRVNEEGRCLDLKGVVPLDEASLISRAKLNTGLEDFGPDDWYEPFRIFVKSLDEEADLTLMGRLMTRSDILMHLEARLRIEETYKRHPEIDDQEVAPIVLIVGSGRSGTSALQNLLSLDPGNGTPRHWEALFPAPPPETATYHTDPRVALADQRMTQWNRVAPEMEAIHEWGGAMPTELIQIEALSFQSNGWLDIYGFVPTFDAYLSQRGFVPALTYARRVLKLLQWKNPRERWLLKSPDSMRYLPDVFKVFPDLKVVWAHRDPIKAVSSMVSLVGTLYWTRSDQPLSEAAIAQLTNPAGMAGLFSHVIDQFENGTLPRDRVVSMQYLDFIDDPMRTVKTLYRGLGIALSAPARQSMEAYLREHPREARPPHRYNVGDQNRLAEERKLFERYLRYFDVKTEL